MKPSGLDQYRGAFAPAEQLLIAERTRRSKTRPRRSSATSPTAISRATTRAGRRPHPPDDLSPTARCWSRTSSSTPARSSQPVEDPFDWRGVSSPERELATDTAKRLFQMSSEIPDELPRDVSATSGTCSLRGARLMFSGDTPEIVEAAFTLSGLTGRWAHVMRITHRDAAAAAGSSSIPLRRCR